MSTLDAMHNRGLALSTVSLAAMCWCACCARTAEAVDLGTAATFGILSSTFTRNTGVTAVIGDLGYTTLGGSGSNTVSGFTYTPSPAQAGTDQATARSALDGTSCTFSFAAGSIDLTTDTTHGDAGVFAPGVYCVTGAASTMDLGTGLTLTLTGQGLYIFKAPGALNAGTGARVVLLDGANPAEVFWVPDGATTLGQDGEFAGTVVGLPAAAITVGLNTVWTGRALAFAGTVTTAAAMVGLPRILAVTVVSATTIALGAVAPGSVTVSATTFDLRNTGTVPATFGFHLADPAPWTSVVTGPPVTAFNSYELDAQLNFPSAPASWVTGDHALRLSPPGPDASTGSRFGGNESGVNVDIGQLRHLWVRLLAPMLTDQTATQDMVITVTAQP